VDDNEVSSESEEDEAFYLRENHRLENLSPQIRFVASVLLQNTYIIAWNSRI